MDKPLLSICIPTYKRPEIIDKLLNSIISQKVDESLYEICITDNSKTDETADLINNKYSDISNLHYKKTYCEGFMNSVEALHFGKGKYIKLHNDYSIFNPGSILNIIEEILKVDNTNSYIFFSYGAVNKEIDIKSLANYDEFMCYINYQATWSSAFGIWKDDMARIDKEGIHPNYMFPHTSYLHRLTGYKNYIVDNHKYVYSAELKKKGGYNLIDNFVRIYLTMVKEELLSLEYITNETYRVIEDGILKFCAGWMYTVKSHKEQYTFTFEDDKKIVLSICGMQGLVKYRAYKIRKAIRYYFPTPIKSLLKKIRTLLQLKIEKN